MAAWKMSAARPALDAEPHFVLSAALEAVNNELKVNMSRPNHLVTPKLTVQRLQYTLRHD